MLWASSLGLLVLGVWAAIWVTPLGWKAPLLLHCGIDVDSLPPRPLEESAVRLGAGSSLHPPSSCVKQDASLEVQINTCKQHMGAPQERVTPICMSLLSSCTQVQVTCFSQLPQPVSGRGGFEPHHLFSPENLGKLRLFTEPWFPH